MIKQWLFPDQIEILKENGWRYYRKDKVKFWYKPYSLENYRFALKFMGNTNKFE